MAENGDEAEDEEPAVALGEGAPVEGAPVARVAARFMWGVERSEIVARAGDTEIRTPDGPRELGDVLESVDETYFPTRHAFISTVEEAVGTGAVPTAEE